MCAPQAWFAAGIDSSAPGIDDLETFHRSRLFIGVVITISLCLHLCTTERPDDKVQRELFDTHVHGRFVARWVLDDRDRVVRLWRDELGLTCLQVACGDF